MIKEPEFCCEQGMYLESIRKLLSEHSNCINDELECEMIEITEIINQHRKTHLPKTHYSLSEAVASGKPFKREGGIYWLIVHSDGHVRFMLPVERSLFAHPEKSTVTMKPIRVIFDAEDLTALNYILKTDD